MLHDDVINELEKEYRKSDKTKYTILFLKGLSDAEVSFETQALSMMKNYHFHKYSESIYEDSDPKRLKEYKKPILERAVLIFDDLPKHRQDDVLKNPEMSPCHLCSMHYCEYSGQEIAEKFYDDLCKKDPYEIMLTLKKSNAKNKLNIEDISDDDYKILQTIFTEIKNANEDDGIRDVFKKLKKYEFFKHWKTLYKEEEYWEGYTKTMFAEERLQYLLECLGYMGILHTERHKGAFFEFYNFGIAPTSSRSSDWNYPVDFWRGKDKIDFEAFDYWFKDYDKMQGIKL